MGPTARWRRRLLDESGAELVEFALSATLFFMAIFGICSFGIGVWRYNIVAELSREGARRAAVCGAKRTLSSSDCDVSAYLSGRSYGLTITTTTTPSDLSTLKQGDTVTVQVQHAFTPLTSFVPAGSITLQSTSKMTVAR